VLYSFGRKGIDLTNVCLVNHGPLADTKRKDVKGYVYVWSSSALLVLVLSAIQRQLVNGFYRVYVRRAFSACKFRTFDHALALPTYISMLDPLFFARKSEGFVNSS